MRTRITDQILEQFAIVARPEQRYGTSIDRVLATFAFTDDVQRRQALAELRS